MEEEGIRQPDDKDGSRGGLPSAMDLMWPAQTGTTVDLRQSARHGESRVRHRA
jgi:hypothetical protein